MDQKLTELVNKVESESRAFASFDDYLASKGEESPECPKPASDAAENSPSEPSEKVDETGDSSEPSSAEAVTVPTEKAHPHSKLTPEYIANGLKTEPVHPVAIPILPEPPPDTEYIEHIPVVLTKLELTDPVNWDGQTLRSVEEVISRIPEKDEPEWWREVYLAGRELAVKVLKDPDSIVDRINILTEEIERRKRAIHGLRSGLDDALKSESSETRKKVIGSLDMDYRNRKNKKPADRMKAERKASDKPKLTIVAKPGIGIKFADTMAMGMGLRGEALIDVVRKAQKLDDATLKHIEECMKLWPLPTDKWGSK